MVRERSVMFEARDGEVTSSPQSRFSRSPSPGKQLRATPEPLRVATEDPTRQATARAAGSAAKPEVSAKPSTGRKLPALPQPPTGLSPENKLGSSTPLEEEDDTLCEGSPREGSPSDMQPRRFTFSPVPKVTSAPSPIPDAGAKQRRKVSFVEDDDVTRLRAVEIGDVDKPESVVAASSTAAEEPAKQVQERQAMTSPLVVPTAVGASAITPDRSLSSTQVSIHCICEHFLFLSAIKFMKGLAVII